MFVDEDEVWLGLILQRPGNSLSIGGNVVVEETCCSDVGLNSAVKVYEVGEGEAY